MAKGHISGRRISGRHSTVTALAEIVVLYVLTLPSVKTVGLGKIAKAKGASNSNPRLTIRTVNSEVILIKVIGKGQVQQLRVSTRDQDATVASLRERFP